MTAKEKVRVVQELRRSNAAQPRPGKRQSGPDASEWESERNDRSASPQVRHYYAERRRIERS